MCSSRNGRWRIGTGLCVLLLGLCDDVVGVFFYVVAREAECKGHCGFESDFCSFFLKFQEVWIAVVQRLRKRNFCVRLIDNGVARAQVNVHT